MNSAERNDMKNCFILLIGFLLLSCNSNQTEVGKVELSVRLPIPIVDAAFAPFYIAQDKGIFNKYGINVILEVGSAELNPVNMVSQGTDDFGVLGGPELLFTGREMGAGIVGIGILHKDSDFVVLITKQDSDLKELDDINGKEVGFFYGHISTDILRALFIKENIIIEEVDVGFNYNLFIADRLPAQWAFRTTAGLTLPKNGIPLNYISPADYGIETHGHTIITNDKMINEKPETVLSFLKALAEATEYSIKNKIETINAIISRDENFTSELASAQLEIYNTTIRNNKNILWIDEEMLLNTKERLIELGLITDKIKISNCIDKSFIELIYK